MKIFANAAFTSMFFAVLALTSACTKSDDARRKFDDVREGTPIIVFAAANLRFAIADVVEAWQLAGRDINARNSGIGNRGDSAVLVFGASGDLTTQILNGAPADVFLAADEASLQKLSDAKLLVDSTRTVYAIGQLAVIAHCEKENKSLCPRVSLRDLVKSEFRVVAIAEPSHAPYGAAARQALQRAAIWKSVEPRLVFGANITQAYRFVTTGNADAGVVALSLVLASSYPYELVDSLLYDPIRQSAAVISSTMQREKAVRFMRFLESSEGQSIMRGYGLAKPTAK